MPLELQTMMMLQRIHPLTCVPPFDRAGFNVPALKLLVAGAKITISQDPRSD